MSEADEQYTVCQYLDWRRVPYFHIANEAKRGPKAQREFKRLGGKPGVPDLCIPVAKGGYFGLYIEMKYGRNKPTENQRRWQSILIGQGYKAVTCWGADEAIAVIKGYLISPATKRDTQGA